MQWKLAPDSTKCTLPGAVEMETGRVRVKMCFELVSSLSRCFLLLCLQRPREVYSGSSLKLVL